MEGKEWGRGERRSGEEDEDGRVERETAHSMNARRGVRFDGGRAFAAGATSQRKATTATMRRDREMTATCNDKNEVLISQSQWK